MEDRATIKAVVSRQAQDGLTIAASFLEQPGETQQKLNQELANCKTNSKQSILLVALICR